jgi:hypothetical protein
MLIILKITFIYFISISFFFILTSYIFNILPRQMTHAPYVTSTDHRVDIIFLSLPWYDCEYVRDRWAVSRPCLKRTVACSRPATTEEDHDPSVPAHTEPRGRGLRVEYVHVSGAIRPRSMLKGNPRPRAAACGGRTLLATRAVSSTLLFRNWTILPFLFSNYPRLFHIPIMINWWLIGPDHSYSVLPYQ